MAKIGNIFGTMTEVKTELHNIWESSNLKSTDIGNIYDVLVVKDELNDSGETVKTPIDVDNAVALKVGEYTGDGLQERYATIAGVGDKIAVTGTPVEIEGAMTRLQDQDYNFYNVAGKDAKAYEVVNEDIFGVSDYAFTEATMPKIKEGAYVVVDGAGKWVAQEAAPDEDTYGFIGKVHSIAQGSFYTIVRIFTLQNVQH